MLYLKAIGEMLENGLALEPENILIPGYTKEADPVKAKIMLGHSNEHVGDPEDTNKDHLRTAIFALTALEDEPLFAELFARRIADCLRNAEPHTHGPITILNDRESKYCKVVEYQRVGLGMDPNFSRWGFTSRYTLTYQDRDEEAGKE